MNRRGFVASVTGALCAAALPRLAFAEVRGTAPTPRLSVMLWTVFRKLPFEQRLEKVAEAGYRAVELVDEFRHWSNADFARATAKRRSLGLTFDATAGLETGIADPQARQRFLDEAGRMLPIMDKLECSRLILLSGDRVLGQSREAQHQSCIEGLNRAADLAGRRNITLLLENIDPEENPKYYLTSVAEGFEIVKKVDNPHVRFLYDFYHEQIAEGNLIEKLQKNINLVGLLHVADVPGRHAP